MSRQSRQSRQAGIRRLKLVILAVAACFALLLGASPAAALDDISIGGSSPTAEGACPALTQIKYPWVTCSANSHGGVTLTAGQPAPLACRLTLDSGACAADPNPWYRAQGIQPNR